MTSRIGRGHLSPIPELPQSLRAFLARDDRFERIAADPSYAVQMLDDILQEEGEDVLHAASQGRWRKANTYSYDAARKSAEVLLTAHGWRVRNAKGAHLAVVELVQEWLDTLPDPAARIARSFGASRKARHDDEYPSPTAPRRRDRDLKPLAQDNIRLVNVVREQLGLTVRADAVPNEENLAGRR